MRPDPSPLARHWGLDPGVVFLNHGSFGACPTAVLERQARYRAEIEANPVEFLARRLPALMEDAGHALAGALGGDPRRLLPVANATTGVNTVVRSVPLEPGDEVLITSSTYRACAHAVRHIAAERGADVVVVPLPVPISTPGTVVDAIVSSVSSRTRLAVIDHVTSPTAAVLPIDRIVTSLADRGVATLVDGAHGPGMLPLDLRSIPALAYVGNCHKWLLTPKGAGFVHADEAFLPHLTPLVVSHGWAPEPSPDRTRAMFGWTGTGDPTPFLAIPDALRFIDTELGGLAAMQSANHDLVRGAARIVSGASGLVPCAPDDMTGTMVSFVLPADAPADLDAGLRDRWGVEVPLIEWPETGQRFVRISAQAYNAPAQYEYLAGALASEL